MKKLLLILTVCLLAFSGCEREEYLCCYKCETIMKGEVISTCTITGITEEEVREYQAGLVDQARTLLKDQTIETICVLKRKY